MGDIVVAPLSHNRLRDWPAEHYATLIGLMLEQGGRNNRILVVGTRGQRLMANAIVRHHPAPRVLNLCGTAAWGEVLSLINGAACVIGNNSGITHVSRHMGVPTVCIFGGSHQRTEWGPLGANATILSRVIACSPCHLNHIWECPYGVACLSQITPEEVAAAVRDAVGRADEDLATKGLLPC